MTHRKGYRGYIGSRPYEGQRAPQHVQNLVVRDYCQRNNYDYLLSATEYHMPGCYIMLEEVMREADTIEGVVLYSIYMLPQDKNKRAEFVKRALAKGLSIHGAVENLAITDEASWQHVEDIFAIHRITKNSTPKMYRGGA